MEKAIIFGVGKNYKAFVENIYNHYDVVALVDNNYQNIPLLEVYPASYIDSAQYDKIIVTPTKYEEIYKQLIEMGVPKDKIILLFQNEELCYKKILGNTFYGQHADDLIIEALFARMSIEKPSYIDLGTNMPVSDSNTIAMYLHGCRGINIEANPMLIDAIECVKPEDTTINVGVATKEGTLPFYIFDETSGLNSFSKDEIGKYGKIKPEKIIELPVRTLKSIVDEYCPDGFPDFLDCDIEGLDYEVLADYDLLSDGPKVICVEVRPNDIEKFDVMLDEKGYYRFCRIGENNMYVQKKYSNVVSHMVL